MKQDPFLQNSVIVTGASLGIGRHLALQLAEKGAWLTLAARSADELDRVAGLCRDRGGEAIAVTTDVSDQSQCKALIERSIEEYGRIDTLINNAGIGMHARFEELPDFSLMETIMRVNFWGSVYCTHYAFQHLKETKGRIVVIISGGGKFVTPGSCGYGASKHAMVGFFDSLRIELAESGVSVTAIYPDWVATGISARALEANGRPSGKIAAQEQGGMLPEECARLILKAAIRRRREILWPKYKLGLLFALIFPNVIDKNSNRNLGGLD
jgi:short-subunit dehydrogenase